MPLISALPLALAQRPNEAALAGGIFALGCVVWIVILLLAMAFPIFCFWRIFTKAGYTGAMSLLWLIPVVGPIIVLCILAFGEWPGKKD